MFWGPSVARHMGDFHVWSKRNHVAMNICTQVFVWISVLWDENQENLLGRKERYSEYLRNSPTGFWSFPTPTSKLGWFKLLYVFANVYYCNFFHFCHPRVREVVYLICLSLRTDIVEHLFLCLLVLYSLEEIPFRSFIHFQIWLFQSLSCKNDLYFVDTMFY